MVETPLAFDLSKTGTVCDAFDGAWAILHRGVIGAPSVKNPIRSCVGFLE
jgi:hypothetical protein